METTIMEELYQKAAILLNDFIPEPWRRIYVFAQINEEMNANAVYFYKEGQEEPYFSGEIERLFNVSPKEFDDFTHELNKCFEELWNEFKRNKQEPWSYLTFYLGNSGEFKVEYSYEDISDLDIFEAIIVWAYKKIGIIPKDEWEKSLLDDCLKKQQDNA